MKLSKSKINSYLKCPREFKFQYIDEIEVPPNEYMALGTDIHLIAENFAKIYGDEPKMDIKYSLELIARQLNINPTEIDEHLDGLADFFKRAFVDNDYSLFSFEEYLVDETHNFSGICDIILEDENGDLIVIDYKTGNSSSFSKYRLELCYYKMLVENVYKKSVSGVGIFFTKNNRLRILNFENIDNKRKYITDNELSDSIDTLYEVRKNINNEIFPKNEQFVCRFCTYEQYCKQDHH